MTLRLYVLDIRELERADLCARAFRLLDPVRKEKVMKTGNEKDRARSVGAGLLLLSGRAELEGSREIVLSHIPAGEKSAQAGLTGEKGMSGEEKNAGRNGCLQILSPAFIIQSIEYEEKKRGRPLSEGISYEISDRGRPAWKYSYFNLSHSGNYAVLVTGPVPVGIDVQEPRRVLHKSIGSYQTFCKLESYLKCTGRGIDQKIDACYAELEEAEKSGSYFFKNIPMPEEYALWICAGPGEWPGSDEKAGAGLS